MMANERFLEAFSEAQKSAWDAGFNFLATMLDVPEDEREELRKHNPH